MPKDPRTIANVPADEIRRIIAKNELLALRYMSRNETANCPVCEREFVKKARHHKFCGDACRLVWFKIAREIEKRG